MINSPSVEEKYLLSYRPDESTPYANKQTKDASKANIRCLDNFYIGYNWTLADNDYKRKFLYPYYNSVKILHGGLVAYEMTVKKNKGMEEPLPEYDFQLMVHESDMHKELMNFHGDGVHSFAPGTQ